MPPYSQIFSLKKSSIADYLVEIMFDVSEMLCASDYLSLHFLGFVVYMNYKEEELFFFLLIHNYYAIVDSPRFSPYILYNVKKQITSLYKRKIQHCLFFTIYL